MYMYKLKPDCRMAEPIDDHTHSKLPVAVQNMYEKDSTSVLVEDLGALMEKCAKLGIPFSAVFHPKKGFIKIGDPNADLKIRVNWNDRRTIITTEGFKETNDTHEYLIRSIKNLTEWIGTMYSTSP